MRTIDWNKATALQHQLRTVLFETGLLVQRFGNESEVRQSIDEINSAIGLTALTALEDGKNVFPVIVARAPHMVSLLEQEQEKIQVLSEKLCTTIEHFEEGFSEGEKRMEINMLRYAFHDWMTEVLNYLNKLELIMQEMTEEDIAAVKKALVAA